MNAPSVLVTGGSRGLGLLLARTCMRRGADVTVAARDEEEIDRAVAGLRAEATSETGTATGRTCDVRDRESVARLVRETAETRGGLDMVFANAGVIQVGPAEAAGEETFRDAMETMFYGALNTSLEALPWLRKSPSGGRLGLIGSVGGLLGVPHLLPYSCAKSAIGALAEGLRAEQAPHGVSVTAVHPGLMRTGSAGQAEFAGDAEREHRWFAALSGMPLLSMDAERAAERIVSAVAGRRARLVLTPAAKLGSAAHGIAPALVTETDGLVTRLLPSSETERAHTTGTRPGRQLTRRPAWQRMLSTLNDRAADRFNQVKGAA